MGEAQTQSEAQDWSITAAWSDDALVPGTANVGDLLLSSTIPGIPLSLTPGQYISIDIGQTGWTIGLSVLGTWVETTADIRGGTEFLFQYQPNFGAPIETSGERVQQADLDLPLSITPPETQPITSMTVTILDEDQNPISAPFLMQLNYLQPNLPLQGFSLNPSVVLLTNPGSVVFPNTLLGSLQNTSGDAISSGALVLSISAQDADNQDVDITQALSRVQIGGLYNWTYSAASQNWSVDLDDSNTLDPGQSFEIRLSQLEMDSSDICVISVTIQVSNVLGTQPYATSMRYSAYGPYTMIMSLDADEANADMYIFTDEGGSNYNVTPLNYTFVTPPLNMLLRDNSGQIVYPPIAGSFSWSADTINLPSTHSLSEGQNPCYFLIPDQTGGYNILTDTTTDLDLTPNEITATGYQQSYGDPSNPNFGPVMPVGAIIMWNGTQIPAGWALCDGSTPAGASQPTPNLISYFIQGTDTAGVGQKGDGDTHTHQSTSTLTTTTDGSHTHGFPTNWYNQFCSCARSGHGKTVIDRYSEDVKTATVTSSGNHHHSVDMSGLTLNSAAPLRPKWFALCFIIKL